MTVRYLWGLLASAVVWSQSPASLPSVFTQNIGHWETLLDKGLSTSVRKEVLAHIEKRKINTPADPNENLALIALKKVLSRAFILEGNWEDGLRHLDEVLESSRDNIQSVEEIYAKLKNDNENKIKTSQESIDKYNPYLQDLQSIRQLTLDQKKRKQELEVFISDQRAAVTQSIKNIETMNQTLKALRQDKDEIAERILNWRVLLEQEKKDQKKYKSTKDFINARIQQIKADTSKPLFDRRAYAARLVQLDPAHVPARKLWGTLLNTSMRRR